MLRIAITGTLSSGKSSVTRFFGKCGAFTISADEAVHRLLSPCTEVGKRVIELLGKEIVVDGNIDRGRVGALVFRDTDLLKKLEAIVHPAVFDEIEGAAKTAEQENYPLFVAEIPLLFEAADATGREHKNFDKVITVSSDLEQCCLRFQRSTGLDRQEFERRMAQQLSDEEKAKRADIVIKNDAGIEELEERVQELYKGFVGVQQGNSP